MECTNVFLIHKPVGVVCATVDSNLGNIVRNKQDERYGLKKIAVSRPTVYDVARSAGFPDNFGLVGRLDTETSGVMLFTSTSELLQKIRDPPLSKEEFSTLYGEPEVLYADYCKGKSKQYELLVLSGKKVASQLIANDGYFDGKEFEMCMSQPFSFNHSGSQFNVGACSVNFIERFKDPKYSHGKPELGWCIRCLIDLHEGKHHQIRRMAHNHDYHVLDLKRVSLAGGLLSINSVPAPGDCRWLTTEEYKELCRLLHVEQ